MITTARNATLADLGKLLTEQQARKLDVVAPASTLRMEHGRLLVTGSDPVLSEDGVTATTGVYDATDVFDEGLADKLGIPLPYMRRLRNDRPDLLDANVNGWLHGYMGSAPALAEQEVDAIAGDPRSFLLRLFKPAGDAPGIARAFLSDRYKPIDHFDILTAVLQGIREAGVNAIPTRCDLSERTMRVQIAAPEVEALAPLLLAGYRSPYTGLTGEDNPTVFAGFDFGNSETGGGAFYIVPRLTIQICTNGMVLTKDAMRAVHLGGKMEEGVIDWSSDTQAKQVALITAKARDAARTFLDVKYMERQIAAITQIAITPITGAEATIKTVAKKLAFSEEITAGVLDHFIRGGQLTAGGVMQAVTSFSQSIDDPDKANSLNDQGIRAMELAAAQ